MCNRMHLSGAKCMTELQYDLFYSAASDTTECSFIESVRYGTYSEVGELYQLYEGGGGNRVVTDSQEFGLVISVTLCGILAVYSCYLHHSITNLLIKSLSHTDLLPPSRHRTSRGSSKSKGRRSRHKRVADDDDDDDDWDRVGSGTLA